MLNKLRWMAVGAAVVVGMAAVTVPANAQDLQTLLSYFLKDLYAGTLGVTMPITTITTSARISSTGAASGLSASATGDIGFTSRGFLRAPADGVIAFSNNAETQGIRFQYGNVPTISSAFGTSPSVVAGSTDTSFSVNVGTGGAATSGVVGFANTWPSAPRCIAQDTTTVGAGVQKVTTSTTLATITTATAWTASDIVNVICIGFRS